MDPVGSESKSVITFERKRYLKGYYELKVTIKERERDLMLLDYHGINSIHRLLRNPIKLNGVQTASDQDYNQYV